MPPPNTEELGLLIFGTARAWRTRLDQRLRPLGLSQGKWRTLIHLDRARERLTQKELARRMGIEEPTLAGLLDRLQSDGWIERRESATDRRCKTVHLQRRSKDLLAKISSTALGLRHELIEKIPPGDLKICMNVLECIRSRAESTVTRPANNGGRSSERPTARPR